MNQVWKRSVATGAILVAGAFGGLSGSEAVGRISERLATNRANSAKDKTASAEADRETKSTSGLLANRSSSGKGLSTRAAKRKEVPPHAKEALNNAGSLDIDLGDTVESVEGPALTPPRVPSTEANSQVPGSRTPRRLSAKG